MSKTERDWDADERKVRILTCSYSGNFAADICLAALAERRRLANDNAELIALIGEFTDCHRCDYDRYNFCRLHEEYRPCPHERAAAVLAAHSKRTEAENAKK